MTLLKTDNLTPRDISSLMALKGAGLDLVEVKISQRSPVKGRLLSSVTIPENANIACVIRNHRPILDLEAVFLDEGDRVFLLTDDERAVRERFTL